MAGLHDCDAADHGESVDTALELDHVAGIAHDHEVLHRGDRSHGDGLIRGTVAEIVDLDGAGGSSRGGDGVVRFLEVELYGPAVRRCKRRWREGKVFDGKGIG